MKGFTKPVLIILITLILDQVLKFWIKLNFTLGQEIHIIKDRVIIHFTENNGMAFGLELGGEAGKLALSLFRSLPIVQSPSGYFILYGNNITGECSTMFA